jgi:hypothetical protein
MSRADWMGYNSGKKVAGFPNLEAGEKYEELDHIFRRYGRAEFNRLHDLLK